MNGDLRPQGGRPRVVIIGGGFGGLYAAKALARAPVDVLLIDRRNFHLFQPLLYQVATGALSPANIAMPLRSILSRQENAGVLLAEVTGFDLERREVLLADGGRVAYDYLVVAPGSSHHYFGHDEWSRVAPGLKTLEDAIDIRRRVLRAFEEAERGGWASNDQPPLTFAVVGGGPTGVELAGAVAEVARDTLRHDYRAIRPAAARVVLVEAADRLLGSYPASLQRRTVADLERLGVEVLTGATVTGVDEKGLTISRNGAEQRLEASAVLWAAGVQASPLGRALAAAAGLETERNGALRVNADLSLPGHPNVFVIGDLAWFLQDGKPLPAVAPVAMQEGAHAARVIAAQVEGRTWQPFRYHHRGSMATIGRSAAVADLGLVKLTGFVGWLAWLFVHLLLLAGFHNRLLVLTQWTWSYVTRNRSARLITGTGNLEQGAEE